MELSKQLLFLYVALLATLCSLAVPLQYSPPNGPHLVKNALINKPPSTVKPTTTAKSTRAILPTSVKSTPVVLPTTKTGPTAVVPTSVVGISTPVRSSSITIASPSIISQSISNPTVSSGLPTSLTSVSQVTASSVVSVVTQTVTKPSTTSSLTQASATAPLNPTSSALPLSQTQSATSLNGTIASPTIPLSQTQSTTSLNGTNASPTVPLTQTAIPTSSPSNSTQTPSNSTSSANPSPSSNSTSCGIPSDRDDSGNPSTLSRRVIQAAIPQDATALSLVRWGVGTNREHWGLLFHGAAAPCGTYTGVLLDAISPLGQPKNSKLEQSTEVTTFLPGTTTKPSRVPGYSFQKLQMITPIRSATTLNDLNGLYNNALTATMGGLPPAFNCVDFINAAVTAMKSGRSSRISTPLTAAEASIVETASSQNNNLATIRTRTGCNFEADQTANGCTAQELASINAGNVPTWLVPNPTDPTA